jgi:hypothetical protein
MRVCQFRHFGLKLLDGGDLIAVRKRKETKDLFLQSWGRLSNRDRLLVVGHLVVGHFGFQQPRKHVYSVRSSRFAGCAPAFGRVELFIFTSLAARLKPCPDKHALAHVNRVFFMATLKFSASSEAVLFQISSN